MADQPPVSSTTPSTAPTFLHATVDGGDSFHQIIAWTLKSRFAANKSELAEVTNSIHSEE